MGEHRVSRRGFVKAAGAAALAAPAIVPSRVLGALAPSRRIQVGAIGVGRISREHDLPGILQHGIARVVAVCDLDAKRLAEGQQLVEEHYRRKGEASPGVRAFHDYRDLLATGEVDAVVVSTPDHWHARPAIDAALAGKDVYLQKPASLTIAEGRQMSDAMHRTGRVFQLGTQQRSTEQFRVACELVRNGRIGDVRRVLIGLPVDPSGDEEAEMPVPKNLDYDAWLGSTPRVYYTEKRVHPQADYSRPGWLRCEQFGAGMITGWGVHHVDIAHWGMGTEYTGPVEVQATAEFPKKGLWDVHGPFRVEARYANGATVIMSDALPNGVRFEGTEGWIFVTRGAYAATASDPVAKGKSAEALSASDPRILASEIGPDGVHLPPSAEHHGNWLEAIRSRQAPISPAEVGHRSTSACLVSHIAMRLGRKLAWDPQRERFRNDDEANAMLSRPQRPPYETAAQV
ncbi:MAG TPA: Gfo/Idh/MocA family oxidoreductase [Vicinamibacteria bacterium]|nr:Gfo/Idh/MocA family oxidoreductase [Vicinamibacteria bacterium]